MREFGIRAYGAQFGEEVTNDTPINLATREIAKVLEKYDVRPVCTYDRWGIVWRVAGKWNDFEAGDGPERLQKLRGANVLGLDLVIPIPVYRTLDDPPRYRSVEEMADTLVAYIAASLEMFRTRCRKDKAVRDEAAMDRMIRDALADVRAALTDRET